MAMGPPDPRTELYRKVGLLKKAHPFLDDLPPAAVREMADAAVRRTFNPGDKILAEGATAEGEPDGEYALYVVESGYANAFIDSAGRVDEYKQGDGFGELAGLGGGPRAATVQVSATGQGKDLVQLLAVPGAAVQAALRSWGDEERQHWHSTLLKEYAVVPGLKADPELRGVRTQPRSFPQHSPLLFFLCSNPSCEKKS